MSYWLDDDRYRHEAVTVRTIWLTIALSLLVHLSAFLWLPQLRMLPLEGEEPGLASDRLQVRLAAIPTPAPAPAPEPPRAIVATPAPKPPPPPRAAIRTPPPVLTAPIAAAPAIAPPPPTPPTTPVPAAPQARAPMESDLWSYIQARRRERGEQPMPPIDREAAEHNANLAANLPAAATGIATRDANRGGGIFEIKRMDYDDAAFEFFGWNNEMGRKTPQLIEVRRGDNSDMRIAVVRKMIAIIREYSKDDFVWRSPRYENGVTLSARVSDNAALENFLMHDFFGDPRRLQ